MKHPVRLSAGFLLVVGLLVVGLVAGAPNPTAAESSVKHLEGIDPDTIDWRSKDEAWWRQVLTPEQFRVCRQGGTERAFTGKYCHLKEHGEYSCSCCGLLLFRAETKFDSGTGWPSFTRPVEPGRVVEKSDASHGMVRVEVRSQGGNSHLGHVFDDGPGPTGLRYCINSASLRFSATGSDETPA